jgi:hypothetical protein
MYQEKLDIKLNSYLKKWLVIAIFYELQWIFSILAWVLPVIPLIKIGIGAWILLP